ncbi:MAG: type I secretion C-terminal target domain-containing protein [Dongiaceae bacterium]
MALAGQDVSGSFRIGKGDTLDLTQVLSGVTLSHDLANLGDYVKVVGYGRNDAGFGRGTKTTLEIDGPNGSARVNLEGSGKLTLDDLLKNNSLILPPH